jgi:polyferredoxin
MARGASAVNEYSLTKTQNRYLEQEKLMTLKSLIPVFLILTLMLLSGCVPGGGTYDRESPAGFFSGVWHGWIAPFSLIVGIFNGDVRVYEPNNTGWLYDFGFYIAIIGGFGGVNLTRRKLKNKAKQEG